MRAPAKSKMDLFVPNDQFWENQSIVESQDVVEPYLFWHEDYLLNFAQHTFRRCNRKCAKIHIIGCGTGREIPCIRRIFPLAEISATDISTLMIEKCLTNLHKWGCTTNLKVECCAADSLANVYSDTDLFLVFNNVLTYVVPHLKRLKTLNHIHTLSSEHGLIVGGVHNQWGRFNKSVYFILQHLLIAVKLFKRERGDRLGGFKGYRTNLHYFTTGELSGLLRNSGFNPLQVKSLANLAASTGRRYNALSNYNNIVFAAENRLPQEIDPDSEPNSAA